MPFLRAAASIVILSLFLAGCTKGCSGTQKDTTTAQPAPKPAASFRIVPTGAECVYGLCVRDDFTALIGFSQDLARPIEWTRESDTWQVNHDYEANLKKAREENKLSVSCDTPQITSLYRTRQKLFYIHRKLTEKDERWKDAEWFQNRIYYDLLFSRDVVRLNQLFQVLNNSRPPAVAISDPGLATDWRLFASELLRYRTMVLSVPDWQEQFENLAQGERNLVSGDPFHEAGFPKTDDACHHLTYIFGGNYIVGYDQGLEGWFYSFWVRRHKEGTMDVVKDMLEWGVQAIPAAPNSTTEYTWSKAVPVAAP